VTAYVINEPCIGTKDISCVEVCPVDCIHPTPEEPGFDEADQLYIDPRSASTAMRAWRTALSMRSHPRTRRRPSGDTTSSATPPTTKGGADMPTVAIGLHPPDDPRGREPPRPLLGKAASGAAGRSWVFEPMSRASSESEDREMPDLARWENEGGALGGATGREAIEGPRRSATDVAVAKAAGRHGRGSKIVRGQATSASPPSRPTALRAERAARQA
jgi:NAD-dependent dihydropyrimidine dehydrogenase PreA subunit